MSPRPARRALVRRRRGGGGAAGSDCQRGRVAGLGQLRGGRGRGRRYGGLLAVVEVGAAVPRRRSPRGISVPADGVEDGAGDLCVLEPEMLGDLQDLGADMLGREGGNELGGILRGTDLPLGPAEAVGPAVQVLVDERSAPAPWVWARLAGSCPPGRAAWVGCW